MKFLPLKIFIALLVLSGSAFSQNVSRVDSVNVSRQIVQIKSPTRYPVENSNAHPVFELYEADSAGTVNKIWLRVPIGLASDWGMILPTTAPNAGEVLTAIDSDSMGWSTPAGLGDITGVTAGNKLTGGGASGDVTIDLGVGSDAGDANTLSIHDLISGSPSTSQVPQWNGANWVPATIAGGGSSIILDLADDASNESTALGEIATSGDVNNIFTEPSANKVLINVWLAWPIADSALTVTDGLITNAMVNASAAIAATKLQSTVMVESENVSLLTNDANYQADSDTSAWDATRAWVTLQSYLTSETGDIEGVTAGDGLGGGGTSGSVTLDMLLDTTGGLETVDDSLNIKLNGSSLALTASGLAVNDVSGVTGANEDDVTLADVQAAVSNDFHNIGGTDDDVPESGDFGAAAALEATGAISNDYITNVMINNAAAIAMSKTALVAGTNITLSTNTLNVDDVFILNTGDVGTGVFDFGGATSFEITNSATPTVDAAGEIAVDVTITDHTGLIRYHDGVEELVVIAVPTANLTTTDDLRLAYNATNNEFEFRSPGAGAGGDNVSVDGASTSDPDFVSTGDIDFVNTSNTVTANLNAGVIVNADVNASAAIAASKLDANLIESSEIDTYSELNAIVADVTLTSNDLIDTSAELAGVVTDGTGESAGLLVFSGNPVLKGFTVNGGNAVFDDGVGDSPSLTFSPQTSTDWVFYTEETGGDLQLEVNTASAETFDINNVGAGTIDVIIDGDLTAANIVTSGLVDGKDIATNAGMLNEAEIISADWVNTANPWANNEIADLPASKVTSGTFLHERGGLEADVSAYNGLIRISSGATSNITDLTGLNTALGSSIADGAHTVETDPTLTDNAAVSIGDNSSGDVTLTFDGDAGTDGKIKYDVSADAFVIDAPASIPADGDLANGQFSFWIDAVGNELEIKFKDSAGDVTQGAFTLLGNSSTGSGVIVLANTPVLTAPNIADFSNAGTDHLDAAGGGQLSGAFIGGAITFPDGIRQTFNPDATNAGLNVGSQAGDPSSPSNGDIWYNSSTNKFRAYENGSLTDVIGGGSSEWTDTGTTLHPTETGDEIVIGASSPVGSAKLSIDGDADQIQFLIQGNATQTTALMILENSAGTDQFTVSNTGDGIFTGTVDAAGGDLSSGTVTLGAISGAIDAGGATSLELPNGAGGTTVDAQGEVTIDATTSTLNFHDGTAERAISPIKQVTFTVENPGASEDIFGTYVDDASTITKIVAVLVGSATPSVTWTVRHSTDRSAAGNEVVTSGTTTTSTTTGSVVTSFNDATVPADSFLWFETTAQSGTVDMIAITVFYRQDP